MTRRTDRTQSACMRGDHEGKSDKMATMLSAKEVALKLDTTPRTLRKFLRSDEKVESPGKGGRYALAATQVNALKRRFDAWSAQRAENAAKGAESDTDATEGDSGDEG
jgi:hypothetical protein